MPALEITMLSFPEILLILVTLLIIFGASRLPDIGTQIGKSVANFKRASKGQNEIDVTPVKKEEIPPPASKV
jgi:sec-independent protein translocase protein TatA